MFFSLVLKSFHPDHCNLPPETFPWKPLVLTSSTTCPGNPGGNPHYFERRGIVYSKAKLCHVCQISSAPFWQLKPWLLANTSSWPEQGVAEHPRWDWEAGGEGSSFTLHTGGELGWSPQGSSLGRREGCGALNRGLNFTGF